MNRAGFFVQQTTGYSAFIPAPLPPDPPLAIDREMLLLLSNADAMVGRLDMGTRILPDPDLFLSMFVRQEAVLSSQIEGTMSTLEDVIQFEIDDAGALKVTDAEEVVNYMAAMDHGMGRLDTLPLSMRLLREIHAILLRSGRGRHLTPGEFRRSQNWIGAPGSTLQTASFVPPPVPEMNAALGELEKYLHQREFPVLIQAGLCHGQFETIHPFLDGNGRVGRLLITLLLTEKKMLGKPVLYLSNFFKRNRMEYYHRLSAIREGQWEEWIKFFLRGVVEVASEAVETTGRIIALRTEHLRLLSEKLPGNTYAPLLLDQLFRTPMTTATHAAASLRCSYKTANKVLSDLERLGLVREIKGQRRNRVFEYGDYMKLFVSRRGAE
ncbi:Fic family protein [soil metagenome]